MGSGASKENNRGIMASKTQNETSALHFQNERKRQRALPQIPLHGSDKQTVIAKRGDKKANKSKLKKQNEMLREELEERRQELYEAEERQEAQARTIQHLRQESADLRARLGKVASDRLTDNNPNIADLSDMNRPSKLGERYSELYSNEWSDAFEELAKSGKRRHKKIIFILRDILVNIYNECKQKSDKAMDALKDAILEFTGATEFTKELTQSLKIYKDERKKNYKKNVPNLQEVVNLYVNDEDVPAVRTYATEATEICWLMCIQDPPLELDDNCQRCTKFHSEYFHAYTISGEKFDFLVWPALLLHTGGPLVQKGVAQALKTKKKAWSSPDEKPTEVCKEDDADISSTKNNNPEQLQQVDLEVASAEEENQDISNKAKEETPSSEAKKEVGKENLVIVHNERNPHGERRSCVSPEQCHQDDDNITESETKVGNSKSVIKTRKKERKRNANSSSGAPQMILDDADNPQRENVQSEEVITSNIVETKSSTEKICAEKSAENICSEQAVSDGESQPLAGPPTRPSRKKDKHRLTSKD